MSFTKRTCKHSARLVSRYRHSTKRNTGESPCMVELHCQENTNWLILAVAFLAHPQSSYKSTHDSLHYNLQVCFCIPSLMQSGGVFLPHCVLQTLLAGQLQKRSFIKVVALFLSNRFAVFSVVNRVLFQLEWSSVDSVTSRHSCYMYHRLFSKKMFIIAS